MINIPPHEKFKKAYKNNEIRIYIDKDTAVSLAQHGLLGEAYRWNSYTWGCLWLGGLIMGPILAYFHSLWWLALIPLALLCPRALKTTCTQTIKTKALEDEEFYKNAMQSGAISRIEEV